MGSMTQETVNLTIHYEDGGDGGDGGDGWILARIAEVPGAISQGRTRAKARANVIDALQTVLTPDDRLSASPSSADAELLSAHCR